MWHMTVCVYVYKYIHIIECIIWKLQPKYKVGSMKSIYIENLGEIVKIAEFKESVVLLYFLAVFIHCCSPAS